MGFSTLYGLNSGILESVQSAIILTDAIDPEFPIIYANPAFESLTGFAPDEVMGANCRFLQHGDTDQPALDTIRQGVKDRQSVRGLLRNYRKDGQMFYNDVFISPVLGADGKVTHLFGCQNSVSDPAKIELLDMAQTGFARLTRREREIFHLMVSGHSNKSIASSLFISARTAEKHRLAVLGKFEASDLTILVRYAIALGISFQPTA